MSEPTTVFFSLGANLGDREAMLASAVAGLRQFVDVSAVSTNHETEPWGPNQEQPCFLNACVAGATALSAEALLKRTKQLEQEIGRGCTSKWGPHLIDIDLIFYGDGVVFVEGKRFPPVSLPERAFVLAPLAEIAPELRHPETGKIISEMLSELVKK